MFFRLVVALFALFFCVNALPNCEPYHNDCTSCLAVEGCGFCGVHGQGFCVPSDISGSQLATFFPEHPELEECPVHFWKFGSPATKICKDAVRVIKEENKTNTKGELIERSWVSIQIHGMDAQGNPTSPEKEGKPWSPTWDVVMFAIGIEDEKNSTNKHFAMGAGFTSGYLGDEVSDVQLYVTIFDNIFEFCDVNDDGLQIADLYKSNWTYAMYEIADFKEPRLAYQVIPTEDLAVKIFETVVETADGKFKAECRTSNGDWTYAVPGKSGRSIRMNPYEMKCDIFVSNWEYHIHPLCPKKPTLALQGFVISANFPIELNPEAQNDNAVAEGTVSMGQGLGFFKWAKTVNGTTIGGTKDYKVLVNDIKLNHSSSDLPPGTPFVTTIFTVANEGDEVTSFSWDPIEGFNPILGQPKNMLAPAFVNVPSFLLVFVLFSLMFFF